MAAVTQHLDIVPSITEGGALLRGDSPPLHKPFETGCFVASRHDQVNGAVTACCGFQFPFKLPAENIIVVKCLLFRNGGCEFQDIHYNLYVPDSYDGSRPYALFFTLPGYEGLYFQGVGENLYSENFGFEAQNYVQDMIIVAPQLSDWGETSADQTIALMEYFLENYNIDEDRVFGEGYSGGGETMSLVMGKRPELFTAYLQCSSQWDGDYEPVVESRTPVYFVIGQDDEYYGSEPTREAYDTLHDMYRNEGLDEKEIDELLVLDIKDAGYFGSQGVTVQHGGGVLFARDSEIMGWLFDR